MKQIYFNELPKELVDKLMSEYKDKMKKDYQEMGMDFNLTELEIKETALDFFRNRCVFFSDHNSNYKYAELKSI